MTLRLLLNSMKILRVGNPAGEVISAHVCLLTVTVTIYVIVSLRFAETHPSDSTQSTESEIEN